MTRSTIAISLLLFVLGVMVGESLPVRQVLAQDKPEQGDWVMQQAKVNAHFDGYILNTRTGEAFYVEERSKTPVKLKP
jgi:uncharacterized protein with NRDE domain